MRKLSIEWCHEIPLGARQLADRRTRDFISHYGANITAMPIQTLAASCYLQGVNDCFEFYDRAAQNAALDFEI